MRGISIEISTSVILLNLQYPVGVYRRLPITNTHVEFRAHATETIT